MRERGSTGVLPIVTLMAVLLTSSSIVYTTFSRDNMFTSKLENRISEVLDDISFYFLVKEGYAKFEGNDLKIVLLVKPMFDDRILLSNISLQVVDKNSISVLRLSDVYMVKKDIFSSRFWNDLNQSFVVVPVVDSDRSLSENSIVNGDIFYIALKLQNVSIGDEMEISIISEYGSISSINIEVPFSLSNVLRIY